MGPGSVNDIMHWKHTLLTTLLKASRADKLFFTFPKYCKTFDWFYWTLWHIKHCTDQLACAIEYTDCISAER